MTRYATLVAQVDGKRVMCRVAGADLLKKYKSMAKDPMEVVTEHRAELEQAARILIEKHHYEEDGSIMIQYGDLQ